MSPGSSALKPADDIDDTQVLAWRQRPKPVGAELSYVIEGEDLVIDSARKIYRVKLGSIEQVRFTYDPGNISAGGFRTHLRIADGRTISFGDVSWKSMMNVERDTSRYRQFLDALCKAVVRANPSCRFVAGKPAVTWLIVTTLAAAAVFGMAAMAWRSWQRAETNAALVFLFIGLAALWQIAPIIWLNQPKALRAGEIPDWLNA